jgi:Fe-S-cluster containining protein
MFSQLNAEQLERVRYRAAEKHAYTSGLSTEKKLHHKQSCPLLEHDACVAYAARPVACRIYLSMNVDSCKYEFTNPSDQSAFPQLYKLPLQAGRKLNEGFAAGLRENGIKTEEHTLEKGLL